MIRSGIRFYQLRSLNYRSLSVWSKVVSFLSPKIDTATSLTLFSDDATKFKHIAAYCDKEYFGGSESSCCEVKCDDGKLIRWISNLQFDEQHAAETKARGGFVAIRFDCHEPIDLLDFEGFDFEIRSDKDITLIFNMKCESYILNDMYQLPFDLKASKEFTKLFAPFHFFTLTADGKPKVETKKNDSLQLQSVGFLATSERCGPGKLLTSCIACQQQCH